MGRSPCCPKEGMNRGAWTALEDKILTDYIEIHGEGRWRNLPKKAGLKRCGKSCRLRWLNYLRPDIKRGNISHDEEELIIRLHRLLGNRWSLIAGRLPGRTDNEIKNYWNTNLVKKVQGHRASTSPPHNPLNQPKERKNPTTDAPPLPTMDSSVVRTKASRCTKEFVNIPQTNKIEHLDTSKIAVGPSMFGDFVEDKSVGLGPQDELPSFVAADDNSLDFMMDLNIEELCPYNFLDSEFSQLCDFDDAIGKNSDTDYNSDLSPSFDQPLLFSEEMLEDWTRSTDCVRPNITTDFRSLASLLDLEEDGLGK